MAMIEGNETFVFAIGAFGTVFLLYGFRRWMLGPTKGSDINKRLNGLVAVITGANTGIGKETARELSKKGAKVIILCRDVGKGNMAAKEITMETKNEVVVMKLDLASLESIRKCAEELTKTEEKIDYLINNAGVMMCPEWRTEDGFEMQIGTNHFGHFLLTELLLPLLKRSASGGHNARVVIVSSGYARRGQINWNDINYTKPGSYTPQKAYGQSKLANAMHAAELGRRLEGSGITVYSLHPGVIATELGRHLVERNPLLGILLFPLRFFIKNPWYGAQTTLYCTLEDSLSNQTGLYYSDCDRERDIKAAMVEEDQKRLWRMSEDFVGLNQNKKEQ